jgi:hypothetical protein
MGTPAPSFPNTIPAFTSSGVLPPYVGGNPALQPSLSPYKTTAFELVDRFATSNERKAILSGLLAYRGALLSIGLVGLQWLDGSFAEDIETTEARSPNDIDLVSFIERPLAYRNDQTGWNAFMNTHAALFDFRQTQINYRADAYFVDVTMGALATIRQTVYWTSLFSHKRATGLWKGMLEVPLNNPQDDAQALRLLATK